MSAIRDYALERMNHLLTALVFQIHRAAKTPGPDPIHDVRVSIRRFSQGLELFGGFFPKPQGNKIKRRLKRLMQVTSEIRNRDIALQILTGSKHADLRRRLIHERRGFQAEFLEIVQRWTRRDFSARWRRMLNV